MFDLTRSGYLASGNVLSKAIAPVELMKTQQIARNMDRQHEDATLFSIAIAAPLISLFASWLNSMFVAMRSEPK